MNRVGGREAPAYFGLAVRFAERRTADLPLSMSIGSQTAMTDTSDTDGDETPPSQAVELYLETRANELSEQTLRSHRYRLQHFVRWGEERNVMMESLDGQKLHEFRLWRREDGDLNVVSLHTQLSTLRVFLKFCAKLDVVDEGLFDKVIVPSLAEGQDRRDSILPTERAEQIASYLSQYEYASFDHALFRLLWQTGIRVGAARSLDLEDYDREHGRIHVSHRPQGGTTLKLGKEGERIIALSSETCVILNDFIDHNRPDAVDENGREPLLAIGTTRPSRSSLRRHIHRVTQPCVRTGECPHDRSKEDCEATGLSNDVSCPSSVPPHDVRRGSITHWLKRDVPKQVISDRMNVSDDVLDKHYDKRAETTKAEQRRQYLDDI